MQAFDLISSVASRALKPDPLLKLSEWSEQHRYLSSKASAEAGKWRNKRTPYLVKIMDCLSGHSETNEVDLIKGAQIGGTEVGLNFVGYVISEVPAPMMMVQPGLDALKKVSKMRLSPLIEASPKIKNKISENKSRDSSNSMFVKEFEGGILMLASANSAASLRSMPIKYLFLDEVDGYPLDVDGEGSPIELAEARTRTFSETKKVFKCSTPTIKGASAIEDAFESSNRHYYHVPCPHCEKKQKLEFQNLKWEKGEFNTVGYFCVHCGEEIKEHHKTYMLEEGEWISEDPDRGFKKMGFHISSLYSPLGWLSWAGIAEKWEAAQGNTTKLKVFINTILGQTWEENGEAPDWRRLYECADDRELAVVPMEACVITQAADVQADRIECHVVAYGRNGEKWTIDYLTFPGDTSVISNEDNSPWQRMSDQINREYEHASGSFLPIKLTAIDSGYQTQTVYEFVRKFSRNKVVAIKGFDNRPVAVSQPSDVEVRINGKKYRRGAQVWPLGSSVLKTELYGVLKLQKPTKEELEKFGYPRGYWHFPKMPEDFFKQITAEQLFAKKLPNGHTKYVWQKIHERNEVLDTAVYNMACAEILGIKTWSTKKWDRLASLVGAKFEYSDKDIAVNRDQKPKKKKKKVRKSQDSFW